MRHSRTDFLAVDPGSKYFAWAEFRNAKLQGVGRDWDFRYLQARWPTITTAVVEKPRVLRGKENLKQTVVDVAWAAGGVALQFPCPVAYPHITTPGKIWRARAFTHLTPLERQILDPFSKADLEHILDAVGIGLKYSGRYA